MLSQAFTRLRKTSRKTTTRKRHRSALRRALFLESLEDRRLLAVFAPEVLYSSGGAYPYNLAVADFNVDGKTDIATANINGPSVGVLKNSGVGTFTTTSLPSGGPSFYNVATGDFNNDTFPDVAATTFGGVGVFLGDGNGGFSSPIYTNASAYPIAAGQINGDANLDLIVATNSSGPGIQFLRGLGNGQFQNMGSLPNSTGFPFHDLALRDVNSDGNLDVIGATMNSHGVYVALGNGLGAFTFKGHFLAVANSGSRHVALGDLNGDGRVDVVTADQNVGSVSVLLGDGTGDFVLAGTFSSGSSGPSSVGIADFDGDSKLDVVVSNRNTNVVGVLLGNGAGGLNPVMPFTSAGNWAKDVVVADFNGDSLPDVAVAYSNTGHVGILLNTSNTPPVLTNVAITPSSINEGNSAALSGLIADSQGGPYTLTVDWGDGAPQTITLPANTTTFSVGHLYFDDNPTSTPSDPYTVAILSLTDSQGAPAVLHNGSSFSTSLSGDIANSDFNNATSATFSPVTSSEITLTSAGTAHSHGGSVNVFLDVRDAGTGMWTNVFSTNLNSGASFSFNNQTFTFPVQSFDQIRFRSSPGQNQTFHGWGGSVQLVLPNNSTRTLTVNNVAPIANAGLDQTVNEGDLVTLNGSFTDQGLDDGHKQEWIVVASNGESIAPSTINNLTGDSNGSGGSTFSFTPGDSGTYTVTYKVTDDDGGVTSDVAVITVNNVAPTLSNLAITSPINENDFATLTGDISDPGTLDTFTLTVDWGEGAPVSYPLAAGATSFSVSHQYLDDNPTGTPSDL